MTEESLISIDIDLEKDGKQFGNLKVPMSTNIGVRGWAAHVYN